MGLFDGLARLTTKSAPIAGAYGGFSGSIMGGDEFRKNKPPLPMELIRENMGVANACVRLNAQLVAKTPLRLFLRTTKGNKKSALSIRGDTQKISAKTANRLMKSPQTAGKIKATDEVEEVVDHPILDLLRKPGGEDENSLAMGQFTMLELTQAYLEVVGTAFWYAASGGIGGTPSELWPLPAQFVQQIPGISNGKIIKEYLLAAGGNKTTYQPEEIIPFRMCDLYNPYLGGFSPLRAAIENQKLIRQAVALANAQVQNGGRPNAMWNPDTTGEGGGMIDPAVASRMRNAIRSEFSRAGSGGIMVSPYPGSITPFSWPMNDIIDAAMYEVTERQIASSFSVPITKLARKDSNRASAESGDYAHAIDAGIPRCNSMADVLNRFLVPMFDTTGRLFMAFDSPVNDDAVQALAQTKAGADTGVAEVNDIRVAIGLDPLDGPAGEIRWVPDNLLPVGRDGVVDQAYVDATAKTQPTQPKVGKSVSRDRTETHLVLAGRELPWEDER